MEKNKKRIIVIDDDPVMRLSCFKILDKEDYLVETYEDGEQGLNAISKQKPDLLVVDLKMPKIGGMEVIARVHEIDPEICILEQGVLCAGPATRSGCKALCPAAGSPYIGCYGPAEGALDYGARLMSAVASVVDSNDPVEIEKIFEGIPDPAGQFYRFNLAGSLMRASKSGWNG